MSDRDSFVNKTQAQPEYQSSDALMRELADQKFALDQSSIVAATNARGLITYVNDNFCRISGYKREELLGKDHRIVNSSYHSKDFFKNMWGTISKGQIWRGEVRNKCKDGSYYWVWTTITPFLDEESKPYQYLAIRQDITDLKLAQETILNQQAQLVTAGKLSAIGEMAAAITHEINNPLAVILGRVEMLKKLSKKQQLDEETLSRLLDSIQNTAQRIEKIVKSMKVMAHQSDDEPFQKVYIKDLFSDSLDLCIQRLKNHGIELIVEDVPENLFVECRSHQIVQVLVNLINNSHDAIVTHDKKYVKIRVFDKVDSVDIWVQDSGNGIPAEVREKLFDPFFSTKRVQYGTGLGLSISRSLISQHQGSLTYIESEPNTTFCISLPKYINKKSTH